jgi:general secretion pathway protein G
MLQSRNRREGGFSLVELMVVISIIGLLAGIVALKVTAVGAKAKKKKVIADVSVFDNAIKLYKVENGRWPQQLEDLVNNPQGSYIDNGAKAMIDPWGFHYIYQYTGTGDPPYRIGSYGADGQPGGAPGSEEEDIFPHEMP